MLGKRSSDVSPSNNVIIKDNITVPRGHISFTSKESTSVQLNPDTIKQEIVARENPRVSIPQQPPKFSADTTRTNAREGGVRCSPKQDQVADGASATSSSANQSEQPKISHEETTARLRNFIKKRTVNEAFNTDKSTYPFQPWMSSVSNLRKATSEPNLKAKSRLRAKLTERPTAFNRTSMSSFSPRKESLGSHTIPRDRIPSINEDVTPVSEYSPPFKFPKLDSNFFKSLPNMKKLGGITPMETDKPHSLISPEDGPLRVQSLLRKEPLADGHGSRTFNNYYPSLAKLITGGDAAERQKEILRSQEIWKHLRFSGSETRLNQFTPTPTSNGFSPFNGLNLGAPPELMDFNSPKGILDYAQAQLIQMQQLSQEQEEIKEQQKLLQQQQERLLKEEDALRQREVVIRKMYYDVSSNLAVADHMVSSLIAAPPPSHAISPMSLSTPDFYATSKQAELLLKKHQAEHLASQAEQLLLLQRSAAAGAVKLNSAFGHYNRSISSKSAPNVQSLAAVSSDIATSADTSLSQRTGIIYDNIMLKHICTCSNPVIHKEIPGRLSSIWARLTETGVAARCSRLKSRKATNEELELVHSREHVTRYGALQSVRGREKSGGGSEGSVIELASKVALGEIKNAFALVRPPGHLAERSEAREGCYFNNVAIAAKYLTTQKLCNRVLIVDWDLEHGNGLQQSFYNDPKVLVVNVHRYDKGVYFPRTGHVTCEGAGEGKGYNVNIPFSGSDQAEYGDPEYLAAFRCIIKPLAEQFCPDIVLVAAGFNAMPGHDSYNVTAECFAFMTQELARLADNRIVVALEGGYDLVSLSQACEMCLRSLLGEQITHLPAKSLKCAPNSYAVKAIEDCISIHRKYWQFGAFLTNISLSVYDAVKRDQEEVDTITALASLSMQQPNNNFSQLANGNRNSGVITPSTNTPLIQHRT